MITILALSWRDITNPLSGGAEVHTHEMLKGLDTKKYCIYHLSCNYKGANRENIIDGIHYIHSGNNLSVIFKAIFYYWQNRKAIDIVIEQCNTHRFFSPLWCSKKKRIFYIHQLTREIWTIMLPGLVGKVGKWLEIPMLRLNRRDKVITVSESTKQELVNIGYKKENIVIIHNAISSEQVSFTELENDNKEKPIFIYMGRYAAYKGIDDAVIAFAEIKKEVPNAKLWVVGRKNELYCEKILYPLAEKNQLTIGEKNENDIVLWGFVSGEKKMELQREAHALLFPSIREGWGIIVIEAALCGTPSIVYNSSGCRDAINFGQAGYLCEKNAPIELTRLMRKSLNDRELYQELRKKAFDYSNSFSWSDSREQFSKFIVEFVDKQ